MDENLNQIDVNFFLDIYRIRPCCGPNFQYFLLGQANSNNFLNLMMKFKFQFRQINDFHSFSFFIFQEVTLCQTLHQYKKCWFFIQKSPIFNKQKLLHAKVTNFIFCTSIKLKIWFPITECETHNGLKFQIPPWARKENIGDFNKVYRPRKNMSVSIIFLCLIKFKYLKSFTWKSFNGPN